MMEAAAHQTLINDVETLIASSAAIEETQVKKLRKVADMLLKSKEAHPLKQNLQDCMAQLRERMHKQIAKRDEDFNKVLEQLQLANAAIKENKLKTAEDATHKALSIAGQIPGLSNARNTQIEKQLDKIYPKMRKLAAWRHWGTTQAREDLIAQVKLLIDSRLDPNKIAQSIRDAKGKWKEWEKSGDHSEHKLWKEFSHACDAAFATCKSYFDAQKSERKANLAKKRELIAGIKTRFDEIDWKQPDWKEIDKWLRINKGQFYKIGHTEHRHHKTLKRQLDEAIALFEEHLGRERARSLKFRQNLIQQITELDAIEDIRTAMNQLEGLKKQWRITVLEKRGVENKLWDQFQKAQDVLYAKRKADWKEQDQERDENLKQKRLIVETLIQAAQASQETLLGQASLLAQTKDQFNAVGNVPRKADKALMNSWRQAQKNFEAALKKARNAAKQSAQNALMDKSILCTELELKQTAGKTIDADKSRTQYAALPAVEPALEAAMQSRFDAAISNKPQNEKLRGKTTEAQLTRCMKLEVMLELNTPEEFSKARMAYQIERLAASMQKNKPAQDSAQSLLNELLTTGPVDPEQSAGLSARIAAISKKGAA